MSSAVCGCVAALRPRKLHRLAPPSLLRGIGRGRRCVGASSSISTLCGPCQQAKCLTVALAQLATALPMCAATRGIATPLRGEEHTLPDSEMCDRGRASSRRARSLDAASLAQSSVANLGAGPILLIMGVAGSGKSTLAAELVDRLGFAFCEGDDLHTPENRALIARGVPLTDELRAPWLTSIADWIDERIAEGVAGIVTCSALRQRYRQFLDRDQLIYVWLDGDAQTLQERMSGRRGHFAGPDLLSSQLATFEAPGNGERVMRVSIRLSPKEQAESVIRTLHLLSSATATVSTELDPPSARRLAGE
jgi:gluconokinase